MNAFAYLRVSGKGQVDGDGFDRQLDACDWDEFEVQPNYGDRAPWHPGYL